MVITMDTTDIGGFIYEKEAELAYKYLAEIEKAATWCKAKYPHRFQFLNEMRDLLVKEEKHLNKFRLFNTNPQSVLTILTPSQALRLLEAYKRAVANDPKIWHAKRLEDILALEADKRRDAVILEIREEYKRRNTNNGK